MRLLTRVVAFAVLAMLISVVGCQKVNVEKKYTLSPGDVKTLIVDGPAREQAVTVDFTSTGPVDVYVAVEKDVNDANDKVAAPKTSLGSEKGKEKGTVKATIPAKAAYGVVLVNAKKKDTEVTLTLKGQ